MIINGNSSLASNLSALSITPSGLSKRTIPLLGPKSSLVRPSESCRILLHSPNLSGWEAKIRVWNWSPYNSPRIDIKPAYNKAFLCRDPLLSREPLPPILKNQSSIISKSEEFRLRLNFQGSA